MVVRMTSDSVRPPEQRYNYRNVFTGLANLVKTEGTHGLMRGLGTNLVRMHALHECHLVADIQTPRV